MRRYSKSKCRTKKSKSRKRSKRRKRRSRRKRSKSRSRKFGYNLDLECVMLQKWMNQFAREHKRLPDHLRYSPARMQEYYHNMKIFYKCQDYLGAKKIKNKIPSVVGFYPLYAESYCNKVNGTWRTIKGKGSKCYKPRKRRTNSIIRSKSW